MKTTIELPDNAFRPAKVLAASCGMTLKRFFTNALEEELRRCARARPASEEAVPWMAGFGTGSTLMSNFIRSESPIPWANGVDANRPRWPPKSVPTVASVSTHPVAPTVAPKTSPSNRPLKLPSARRRWMPLLPSSRRSPA